MPTRYQKSQSEVYGYEPVPQDKLLPGVMYFTVPEAGLIVSFVLSEKLVEESKNMEGLYPHFASRPAALRYHHWQYGNYDVKFRHQGMISLDDPLGPAV